MNTPDFSDLQEFMDEWGYADAHQRLNKRSNAELSSVKRFYDAVVPRLEEIIEFLNRFPVDEIPEEYQRLAYMALAACEVDDPVNVWNSSELTYNSNAKDWRVKKSFYDYVCE
ncbi:MAG: hypothetical protein F4147_10510 [Gammaproteobacteria bacterium]|nr:hypothetical protein [Gammaproteobacteria bacterium]MDE0154928.1 hypothetical protein [Gammaproteobacteria bacterium]MYH70480.1 hypothetical protein [Gammaproteobacteria bacterium]